MSAVRQPDRAEEFGRLQHPPAGVQVRLVGAVGGVAGGDECGNAAGSQFVEGLEDGVVVDGVASAGIEDLVAQLGPAVRDVGNGHVDGLTQRTDLGKGLVADVRVGEQPSGDGRGNRVGLRADQTGVARRVDQETPRAHTVVIHSDLRTGLGSQRAQQPAPDQGGVQRVRVVGVEGGGTGLGVLLIRQKSLQCLALSAELLSELLTGFEKMRGGPPPPPLAELGELHLGCSPLLLPELQCHPDGLNVVPDPLALATRLGPQGQL